MEQPEQIKVAVLEEQMKTLGKGLDLVANKIDVLTDKIDNNYVKKEDFKPVKDAVESLKLWQAKVIGMAFIVAVIVDYIIRFLTKST